MNICIRLDLDYVPWDTPDAESFGHGEPSMFLRCLDLATSKSIPLNFFCSTRVLRVFPALAVRIKQEGHALEWLNKHPNEQIDRLKSAIESFESAQAEPQGFGLKSLEHVGTWTSELDRFRFVSASPGAYPSTVRVFPLTSQTDRDAFWDGITAAKWADKLKAALRNKGSGNLPFTIIARPQVMAKYDPNLLQLSSVISYAQVMDCEFKLFRDLI